MNLTNFRANFQADADLPIKANSGADQDISDVTGLMSAFGGTSYNGGLYRIMSPTVAKLGQEFISTAFPQLSKFMMPFSYDWAGSIFAVNSDSKIEGLPGVSLIEPGTAKVLRIPANLVSFHEKELVDHRERALGYGFHHKWISSGGASPQISECIGYKKPLFLGGKDVIENLEIADLDVYWTINAQIIRKVMTRQGK